MTLIFQRILLIINTFLFLSACSSVRSNYFDPNNQSEQDKKTITEINKTEDKKSNNDARFKDTTIIKIGKNEDTTHINPEILDQAIKEFDSEQYSIACPKFRNLTLTISEGDSIYYESLFYLSECELIEKKLEEGKSNLEILVVDSKVPFSILQKALVRLGQVYCVLNEKQRAQEYFTRLKTEFPDSIYLKLANCAAVGVK